jgi:pyruvate,orthophosphate dikinase
MNSHLARENLHPRDTAHRELQGGPVSRGDNPGLTAAAHASAPACEAVPSLPAEVYLIGCGGQPINDPHASATTMGGKAWNLLRMAQLSLPVPPAFVLGTHYCVAADAHELTSGSDLWKAGLHALECATGLSFGDGRRPLLLSVRSGAPVSMPGMMQTILNVGLCDATVGGLLRRPAIRG